VKTPITKSKVSDFAIESQENGEVTEDILSEEGYSLMIVAYKLYGSKETEKYTVRDTVWQTDTIQVTPDSMRFEQRFVFVRNRELEREVFVPEAEYAKLFTNGINPLADAAKAAGWKVYAVTYLRRF
jgi:hypothetical protein